MKTLIIFLGSTLMVPLFSPAPVLAQTDARVQAAAATASSAAAGLPIWAWIVIAVVVLLLLAAIARRRRATQAIIKTRLG